MNGFVQNIRANLSSSISEIESNPRLQRMTWIIGYIVLLYVVSFLYDLNEASTQEKERLSQQLLRLESTDTLDVWNERLTHESGVLESLESNCWRAATPQLASADMQTVLRQLSATHGLESVRLDLAEAEEQVFADKTGWLVRAQLSAKADTGLVPPLVNALESLQAFFIIERMQFVQRRGGSLELLVAACFLEVS